MVRNVIHTMIAKLLDTKILTIDLHLVLKFFHKENGMEGYGKEENGREIILINGVLELDEKRRESKGKNVLIQCFFLC